MKNKKQNSETEEIKESKTTEATKIEVAEDKKSSLSRRRFLGRTAIGGAATAGFLALPSIFTNSGVGLGQVIPGPTGRCPTGCEIVPYDNNGDPSGEVRRKIALTKRADAANYQIRDMVVPQHPCNGDEQLYANRNFIGSFTKGLKRANGSDGDIYGEVDPIVYCALLRAFDAGSPASFESSDIILGFDNSCLTNAFSDAESRLSAKSFEPDKQRRLENPQAGLNFDTEGKDYYQLVNRLGKPISDPPPPPVAFPRAPELSSKEEATEIVENYWQALTRDVPFINYSTSTLVAEAAQDLSRFTDYYTGPTVTVLGQKVVTPQLYSRGITPGDRKGPYLAQFFLRDIPYGRQTIDVRIDSPKATKDNDFMTTAFKWLEIQKGRTPFPSDATVFDGKRFIRSGRDLAEFVHVDAIYQAYLNAALLLITKMQDGGLEAPLNPANPYLNYCKQNNFVEFGFSQLLTLIGEISVRAHKAVWYQKWQVHRRLRPEAFGGLVHFKYSEGRDYPIEDSILLKTAALPNVKRTYGSLFLPQAFPEGSPMHPSYGAGHATLAGACVTLLKAWFDSEKSFIFNEQGKIIRKILVPTANGLGVDNITDEIIEKGEDITIADELNKLAANMSIARNIAGVHWRSDYTESILLGEQVAIQLLEEYGYTYNENFKGFSFRGFLGNWYDNIGKNR